MASYDYRITYSGNQANLVIQTLRHGEVLIKFKFVNPQKRKYATRNTFNYLSPQPAVPKDISKIKPEKLTRKEKKKWKKDMTRYGAVS